MIDSRTLTAGDCRLLIWRVAKLLPSSDPDTGRARPHDLWLDQ